MSMEMSETIIGTDPRGLQPASPPEAEQAWFPKAPASLEESGIAAESLADLVLKLGYTVTGFTTEAASKQLCLPVHMLAQVLELLKADRLVEILGVSGPFGYRFAVTDRGRARAVRLLEISGYVGPAPVSLDAYSAAIEWQCSHLPKVSPEQVAAALTDLVLPESAIQVAGLAGSSGRSLFIYGPPGNGKTSLGHLIHDAQRGYLWVPYCIAIDNNIIRVFDPQCHVRTALPAEAARQAIDQRWICIRRPFIVAAGEVTIDALELSFSRARGYYEAPLHVKANGGTFLLDDFGRQRVEPRMLLNRWTFPLEHGVDYLTLQTGQKVEVPFRQMLIVCTNLDPQRVMDPAFLRRLGYRLLLDDPPPERYTEIFSRYARERGLTVPSGLIEWLVERYRVEHRSPHSCEPRDLIERALDICTYQNRPPELSKTTLELAWTGYFGEQHRSRPPAGDQEHRP